ncbi:MAG: cyclic nucleotide-binding domain-containing protein [Boseongicola sp.]|nr:MAG: cyclic nucleotide-binding domain-containing protein [Boseongicola sp.]
MLAKSDVEAAKTAIFFGSLPPPVFDAILQRSRIIEVKAGQTLFHQGENAAAIFAVLNGMIKLTVTKRDGEEVVVETFAAGSSFAEALAFERSPYPVSAAALVDSRILMAPSGAVRAAVHDNPDAFSAILAATYRHLHHLVRQIEQLKSDSGLERLGHYILARSEVAQFPNEVEIPVEKKVLASLLGMKPETLSRAFKRMREHGVKVDGPIIRLDDPSALRRLLDAD